MTITAWVALGRWPAAIRALEAPNYNHYEMGESFGNPYGPSGRAALALMKLSILG
jgi:hypothetical protein